MNTLPKCPYHSVTSQDLKKDLFELNSFFLKTHSSKKETAKKSLGVTIPIIFLKGDEVVFKFDGERTVVKYVPEQYHLLKSIAHIACTADNLFSENEEIKNNNKQIQEHCLKLIDNLEHHFAQIPEHPLSKYSFILKQYKELFQAETKQEKTSKMHALEPSLHTIIQDAANCRLDALHAQVNQFKDRLTTENWDQLIVVNMGPQMPRDGELASQYFSAVLNKPENQCPYRNNTQENFEKTTFGKQRLVYAESIYDEDQALNLVVTHICDEKLGKHVLRDKSAAHADVLKNASANHIKEMHLNDNT